MSGRNVRAGGARCGVALLAAAFALAAGPSRGADLHDYFPPIPQLERGGRVYTIDRGDLGSAEAILIATLQGIVAQRGPAIYIRHPRGYVYWLEAIRKARDLVIDRRFEGDPWGLVEHFRSSLDGGGYVLYELGTDSLNVATTLAGLLRAVAVDASIRSEAEAHGLRLALDARGRDERWAFERYGAQLRHGPIIQQRESLPSLRDLGPAVRAFTFFDGNSPFMGSVLDAVAGDTLQLGAWDTSVGEDQGVRRASRRGVFTVPTDHAWNLSTLAAVPVEGLRQPVHDPEPKRERGVHHVTFVMTDGDNVQWQLNDFATDRRWFGSPLRGRFPMGWTVSPMLVRLAPAVLDWLYGRAKQGPEGGDSFVCGTSGCGYFYPSLHPRLATHCARLDAYLAAADLSVVMVNELDRSGFDPARLAPYLRQEHVLGLLYVDYGSYAYFRGRMLWSEGKPIVSARFSLWEGQDSPESIARAVAALPHDPRDPGGYSFVCVHPWSRSLDDVRDTFERLDPAVRVVGPERFFREIIANLGGPPEADPGGDREVEEGAGVEFDGTGSRDPNGDIVLYEWDFDGDGAADAEGARATWSWPDDAVAIVTLRVTDSGGRTDEAAVTVRVRNVPPRVDAGPDRTAVAGAAVSFAARVEDPGADPHLFAWDFGDGGHSSAARPAHAFREPGRYAVRVRVSDGDGGVGEDTVVVRVLQGARFIRGDANGDGALDIADAIRILEVLFGGRTAACEDALDANDDGAIDIADPIRLLLYLYRGAPPPPGPFPDAGPDPTLDGLECRGSETALDLALVTRRSA